MSLIKDLARQGKDRALSKTLEVLGRQAVSRYGTLCDIRLDSRSRKIEFGVLLKGESSPVRVTVNRYDVISQGERASVVVRDVAVSREWMNTLAEDILKDRPFEIPHKYSKLLDMLI